MRTLVFKQLRHEAPRAVLTVLAIAGIIGEILILEGFLAGLYAGLRDAVLNRGGDLIVTQAGVSNFMMARSILPQTARGDVEMVEGVREAHPLTGISVIYERDAQRMPIVLLVYDTAGGPASIVSGKAEPGDGEIIIDRAIAVKYGLSTGDPITISDFEFIVGGVSDKTSAFLTPFAFIKYDDLIDFYFESDIATDIATFPLLSFLLVEVEPGSNTRDVAARIEEQVAAADVFLPQELALRDEGVGRQLMGPILDLLLVVSYGIGVVVVGMFMFASVRGRIRDFGVLRALGFSPRKLGGAVLMESLILTLCALPIGVLLARLLAEVIRTNAPIYLILPGEPLAVMRTAAACLLFGALGAMMPVRTIARIDPAVVFRR